MHDGVAKSIFAHLIPAKGMDFPGCEKVVKTITKDSDSLGAESCFGVTTNLPLLHWGSEVGLAVGSTGNVCRGRPAVQRRCRKFGKNVIKGMSDRSSWRSSPPSVLNCRRIMTSCFAIGRDWKTAYEMSVSVVDAAAAITTRRLGPLDSRFEQGGYWDQWMDRTRSSGVVKARTIKWLLPGERWNCSLSDVARGQ